MNDQNQDGLQQLLEEVAQDLLEDEQESDQFLKARGYDPDVLEERGQAFAEKLLAHARRRIARREASSIKDLKEEVRARLNQLTEAPKRVLANLLAEQSGETAGVHFRKLEDVSEEDAVDMLGEMELLKLLEQLDKEDDDTEK